jgi:triacylglycerol esterase/lipase EstA (alpha/beta hydrolase family)
MLAFALLSGHALSAAIGMYVALRLWPGAGWPVLVAAALAIPVLQVLIFVTVSALIAHVRRGYRPAEAQVGPLGGLLVWLGEIAATAAVYLVLMPFERLLMRRDPPPGERGSPVLLVHGYSENAGALFPLWLRLRREGFAVYTHNMEPIHAGIDDYAPALAQRLARIGADSGARVAVVCHSMGGLALRAYLRAYGAAHVARIVTLGTPHGGTIPARMGLGENARQMRADSPWLAALLASEHGAPAAPITSIFSWHDTIVSPQINGSLDGAKNVAVSGVGHIALPWSVEVQDLVVKDLRGKS